MPDLTQDEQRRYSWYARFMQQAGAAPKSFEEWRDLFNRQRIDVSPQGTDRDNGPVMSGELAKNATGEATYEIQRQASSPWDGFWESFFRGARGVQPEVQNDPLPEVPDEQAAGPAEVQPEPEPEVQPEPQPKVQNDPLVTTLSEIMDQYVQKQRTIQEWTQDLDRALRRQSLAKGFDPTADRHHLVKQLGDALDHEMLVAQLTDMLDIRSSSYSADEAVDLGAEPDRYPEHDEYKVSPPLFEGAPGPSTPKIHPWEPPSDIDPEKRTPHPDPSIEPQDKQHWTNRWNVRNMFRDHLASHDISDEHKAGALTHIQNILKPLTPAAIDRLGKHVQGLSVYPTESPLTKHAIDLTKSRDISSGREPLSLGEKPVGNNMLGGVYDRSEGRLHLPLSHTPLAQARVQKSMNAPHSLSAVYMHELAHAVDQPPHATQTDTNEISSTNEWLGAWLSEIRNGQLNRHSTFDPSEGFAEFARLAWTNPGLARDKFPHAYSVFVNHGIVDPSAIVENLQQQPTVAQQQPATPLPSVTSTQPRHIGPRIRKKDSPGQKRLFTAKRSSDGRSK